MVKESSHTLHAILMVLVFWLERGGEMASASKLSVLSHQAPNESGYQLHSLSATNPAQLALAEDRHSAANSCQASDLQSCQNHGVTERI